MLAAMDLAIFFEAIGNLLLVTILFVAVLISAALSLVTYLFRSIKFSNIKSTKFNKRIILFRQDREARMENTAA